MTYTPFEHHHRFASWAAARAAQRSFTSVDVLCRALWACDVVDFLRQKAAYIALVGELRGRVVPDEPFWKLEQSWPIWCAGA